MARKIDIFCVCIVCFLASASGKYIHGEKNTPDGWQYLDNFNFDSGKGFFRYNISYPRNFAPMKLLFYSEGQFRSVNTPDKTCQERIDFLTRTRKNQILSLDSSQGKSGCRNKYTAEKFDMVFCTGEFYLNSDRAARWYVVASRCGSQNGITTFFFFQGMLFQYYIDANLDELFPFLSGQAGVSISCYTLLGFFVLARYFV